MEKEYNFNCYEKNSLKNDIKFRVSKTINIFHLRIFGFILVLSKCLFALLNCNCKMIKFLQILKSFGISLTESVQMQRHFKRLTSAHIFFQFMILRSMQQVSELQSAFSNFSIIFNFFSKVMQKINRCIKYIVILVQF